MTKTEGKNSRVRQVQKRKLSTTGRICKSGLGARIKSQDISIIDKEGISWIREK